MADVIDLTKITSEVRTEIENKVYIAKRNMVIEDDLLNQMSTLSKIRSHFENEYELGSSRCFHHVEYLHSKIKTPWYKKKKLLTSSTYKISLFPFNSTKAINTIKEDIGDVPDSVIDHLILVYFFYKNESEVLDRVPHQVYTVLKNSKKLIQMWDYIDALSVDYDEFIKMVNGIEVLNLTYTGLDPEADIYKNIELYHNQNEEMGKPSYSIQKAEEHTRKVINGM